MRIEWDDAKRRTNLRRHGVDFADLWEVFEGVTVTLFDDRFDYGEDRFFTLGLLKGRVVAIAHRETDEEIRIISARKATKNEEIHYLKEAEDQF